MSERLEIDNDSEKLRLLLAQLPACVTYIPTPREVDFHNLCDLSEAIDTYSVKPLASLDPQEESSRAMEMVKERNAAVLVPGRRFDALGTRHGKGAGWYDRFLSQVPQSWIRIGFCFDDQFSHEPLIRQSWDEPVDYVVVVTRETGSMNLYTTHART